MSVWGVSVSFTPWLLFDVVVHTHTHTHRITPLSRALPAACPLQPKVIWLITHTHTHSHTVSSRNQKWCMYSQTGRCSAARGFLLGSSSRWMASWSVPVSSWWTSSGCLCRPSRPLWVSRTAPPPTPRLATWVLCLSRSAAGARCHPGRPSATMSVCLSSSCRCRTSSRAGSLTERQTAHRKLCAPGIRCAPRARALRFLQGGRLEEEGHAGETTVIHTVFWGVNLITFISNYTRAKLKLKLSDEIKLGWNEKSKSFHAHTNNKPSPRSRPR